MSEVDHVQLWLKLVQLKAADDKLVRAVVEAARSSDPAAALSRLENDTDEPILRREPSFASVRPALLLSVHGFIDLHPTGDGTVVSDDGCFTYIAAEIADRGQDTTVDWLHQLFFRRLLEIYTDNAEFGKALRRAAGTDDYGTRVGEVETWLFNRPKDAGPETPALLAEADPDGEQEEADWRRLLGRTPLLSQIPVEYVRTDPSVLPGRFLDRADRLRNPNRFAQASQLMLEAARSADASFGAAVGARLEVARDVLARRQFAKVHMLEFGWPDLMARVRAPDGKRRLDLLEKAVLFGSDEADLAESWQKYKDDERLVDFLRIRPHISDIFADEFSKLVAAAGTAASAGGAGEASGAAIAPLPPYADLRLDFVTDEDDQSARNVQPGDAPPDEIACTVTLTGLGPDLTARLRFPIAELLRAAWGLVRFINPPPDVRAARPPSRDISIAVNAPAEDAALDIGRRLWQQTFGEHRELDERLTTALTRTEPVRLTVSADSPWITDLPWECLYLPSLRRMAGHTIKMSVVRHVPDAGVEGERSLAAPVRMLIVHAEPLGQPLPGAEQEIATLERLFARAEQRGEVRLRTLRNATAVTLQQEVRTFRPQILHFIGHATAPQSGEAGLVLCDENGGPTIFGATSLGEVLQDFNFVLAVLNGCETGVERVGITHGICQEIIRAGVPAAVATTRLVLDTSALWFSRELYRALMDGYPLEAGVAEARKALRIKKWDWSAYAFYSADPTRLGSFNFPVAG
ncbi:CHAT domain-containing protein [Actinoplanes sp. LDG1-06]|uniref:CHAT domain-containing protein n=1 Tax=Paractinoplanes ovalisporus TaxID=2810368 RepID=A0ABS2A6D3_9ACTN|nr:CHAT domain-containing protein [Actinoplanes ovalisporus]MBM2615401.1 CHAT domain-containing protein [Actinoplanes ovalisporus]